MHGCSRPTSCCEAAVRPYSSPVRGDARAVAYGVYSFVNFFVRMSGAILANYARLIRDIHRDTVEIWEIHARSTCTDVRVGMYKRWPLLLQSLLLLFAAACCCCSLHLLLLAVVAVRCCCCCLLLLLLFAAVARCSCSLLPLAAARCCCCSLLLAAAHCCSLLLAAARCSLFAVRCSLLLLLLAAAAAVRCCCSL
jgi:hypothetical protein